MELIIWLIQVKKNKPYDSPFKYPQNVRQGKLHVKGKKSSEEKHRDDYFRSAFHFYSRFAMPFCIAFSALQLNAVSF